MEIVAKTGREAYPLVVEHVLKTGRKRSPRGRATRDAGFTTILLETPFDALPLDTGRRVIPAIAAAEALQLIGATTTPNLLFRIAPKFRNYVESDGRFHGAYGARIKSQASQATNKLRRDENTRQAVITLWDPILDNLVNKLDYPCTIALQFQVEDGKLCMNTVMRSNDVWLGLAYDMFQFTQLQMSVARSLSLAYGWYRHTAMSLHAYDDDLDNLGNIHPPSIAVSQFQPMGVGEEGEAFTEITRQARDLVRGVGTPRNISEQWFANMLVPYHRSEERREARRATDMG